MAEAEPVADTATITTAPSPAPFDNRRRCHYPGNRVEGAVGRLMGPNTLGEWLTVDEAIYDPETNRTLFVFRYAMAGEVPFQGFDLESLRAQAAAAMAASG